MAVAPAMIQTATVFGLIWAGLVIASGMVYDIGLGTVVDLYAQDSAQAVSAWLAIEAVYNGLGGEHEIPEGGVFDASGKDCCRDSTPAGRIGRLRAGPQHDG
jgi:hypothetical protein